MGYIVQGFKLKYKEGAEPSPENQIEEVRVDGKFFNSVAGALSWAARNLGHPTLPSEEEAQTIIDAENVLELDYAEGSLEIRLTITKQPPIEVQPE